MCFSTPKIPDAPPVPSRASEEAKSRRANEMMTNAASQGRAATVITTPLGDPNFGKNVQRTTIGGF
jgi:hypothetical protein